MCVKAKRGFYEASHAWVKQIDHMQNLRGEAVSKTLSRVYEMAPWVKAFAVQA